MTCRISALIYRVRIVSLTLFAPWCLGFGAHASALPLYASRQGKTCIACHYDPNGGGMRNDFGFLYEKNRHGLDTEAKWAKVTVDPRINDWIAIGLDTRVLYIASHSEGGPTLGTSTFFPMQGQLNIAISPHDNLTIVSSHGIRIDPDRYEARELYGLIQGLPRDLYVQVGRFRLPFGLRQDDHTSYIRTQNFLPYDSQLDHAGIEVGTAGSRCFAQLSFTNGSGTISSERAQTLAAKAGVGGERLAAGVSGFHQFHETIAPRWDDRWALYAMTTWRRLTAIGEYGGGTSSFSGSSPESRNLYAAFYEIDYRAARGINLRTKFDYLVPDREQPTAFYRRWLIETDLAPVPFTEVKLSFRNHAEASGGEYQEYLVQFFFPF